MSLDIIVIIATCLILRAENICIILVHIITTLVYLRVASLCISLRYECDMILLYHFDGIVLYEWRIY